MKKLVSIIVPIYNTENELERCIKSIINQSYNNLEIILVDDGSTDNSGIICDKYLNLDKRIKVIHKKNGGVSQSRNIGINNATGDKIIFVDSDDYIGEIYVEMLMKYENIDLVICGYTAVEERETKEYTVKKKMYMDKDSILKNITRKNEMNFYFGPVLKLFDANIIKENDIFFHEEMEYGEDTCFVYNYISKINQLRFINTSLYYNNITREESLSRKERTNVWKEMYQVFRAGYEMYPMNSYKYKKQITQLYLRSAKTTLNYAVRSNMNDKDFEKLCASITDTEEFKETKIGFISVYDIIILLLLKNKQYSLLKKVMLLKNKMI